MSAMAESKLPVLLFKIKHLGCKIFGFVGYANGNYNDKQCVYIFCDLCCVSCSNPVRYCRVLTKEGTSQ